MQQEQIPSTLGSTLLIFLAGAVVGAVVMALVAPERGSELREDLQDFASRTQRKIRTLTSRTIDAWQGEKQGAPLAVGHPGEVPPQDMSETHP